MKKLTVLALVATVLMAAPMFAVQRNLNPTPAAQFTLPGSTAAPGGALGPATTNNNDTCDIGVTPAASLLLPYFEVETAGARGSGPTTLFTITNTSRFPQIAHVTVWTDWSYPVLDFNIFLTGYDVQPIDLYDVIVRGVVAPPPPGVGGTSSTTTPGTASGVSTTGSVPAANNANPNIQNATAVTPGSPTALCAGLPGNLPSDISAAVLLTLTTGRSGSSTLLCNNTAVGGNHNTKAIGYVTVDVNANCNTFLPTEPAYYTSINGLLYDNVLMGDYDQIGPSPAGAAGTGFDAGGNTMVHIRAIPEGGPAGTIVPTTLPFTFYNRYSTGNVAAAVGTDRRQPLPSAWAARFIQGGPAALATDYKIWREGVTGGTNVATCAGYVNNSTLLVPDVVRFDEHENSTGLAPTLCRTSPCGTTLSVTLPETSRTSTTSTATFPPLGTSGDAGGWMYLNLTNNGTATANILTASRAGFGADLAHRSTSQNWVIVSQFGNLGAARVSVDFDGTWLANGCTPAPIAGAVIGPNSFGQSGNLVCPSAATYGGSCPAGTQLTVPNP